MKKDKEIETVVEKVERLFDSAIQEYCKKYSKYDDVTAEEEAYLSNMLENTAYTYALTAHNLSACIEQIDNMTYDYPPFDSDDYISFTCDLLAEVSKKISKDCDDETENL